MTLATISKAGAGWSRLEHLTNTKNQAEIAEEDLDKNFKNPR